MSADEQIVLVTSETPVAGERQRLMRDALVNNLSAPVTMIVGILLVPVMLRVLGQDNYGLWIVATSISGILAVDFGLYWSVNRVVAADRVGNDGDNADFVRSAATVYVLIGMTGCVVLGGAGLLSGDKLHLPPVERETAILIFWLVGATYCTSRMGAFGLSVLAGLRRFDLINTIAGLASITWAIGVVIVLINGGSVTAVVACQLTVEVPKSFGMLCLIARLSPRYGFRPFFIRWKALRRHVSFAASSLLMDWLSNIAWNSAPMLIGLISGSAAAVPFYIGQKFPVAVSAIACRAAEVLFPAASEISHDLVKSREVLRVGSRWVLVLVLPFTALLFVAAPDLLHAWIGNPPPGSVNVLRIMTATVLAEVVLLAPVQLLWGRGAIRPVLFAYVAQGTGVVALTLALVYKFGVTGAAWGMLVPIAASAVILFVVASRVCVIGPCKLAAGMWRGLTLPVLACAIGAWSVLYFLGNGRLQAASAMAAGGMAYITVLFGFSGNSEEKQFARDIYRRVQTASSRRPHGH